MITNEELNPTFIDTITSNVGLLAGFIGSVTVIGGIMVTVGVWLKKTVTKENASIRKDTLAEIDRIKSETTTQIKENRSHIDNVKTVLEHKIDSATNVLSNTLSDQKEAMISIKTTMEKVDDKLERNVQNFLINKTRIDGHEGKIDTIEHRMYGAGGYDDNMRRQKRKNNIDARYSLEATEDEVEEEHSHEITDEKSRLTEQKRRKDHPE